MRELTAEQGSQWARFGVLQVLQVRALVARHFLQLEDEVAQREYTFPPTVDVCAPW